MNVENNSGIKSITAKKTFCTVTHMVKFQDRVTQYKYFGCPFVIGMNFGEKKILPRTVKRKSF